MPRVRNAEDARRKYGEGDARFEEAAGCGEGLWSIQGMMASPQPLRVKIMSEPALLFHLIFFHHKCFPGNSFAEKVSPSEQQ